MARNHTIVLKAAASRQLTTVAFFKTIINKTQTDQDAYLAWAVQAASGSVEQYCNRIFALELLFDLFRIAGNGAGGPNNHAMVLSRPTVTTVSGIIDSSCPATTIAGSMDNAQTTMASATALPTTYPFNAVLDVGAKSEVVTVTSLASGTTYNVTRGVSGTAFSHASGATLSMVLDSSLYDLDADSGVLSRLSAAGEPINWPEGWVSVFFTAGYLLPNDGGRNLPYDVEDATIRLMRYMWFTRDRDPALRSEGEPGVGNKVYWVGPPSEQGNMPPDVAAILDNYYQPVFGG